MADTELLAAIQEVLKKSLIFDGVTRGIRESVRCIEAGQAQLVILAEDCDQPGIPALVEALCAEQGVNLVKVPERKQLGEWAGLCKIDQEGNATKVVACSCVVVRDFGEQSEGLNYLLDYLKESVTAADDGGEFASPIASSSLDDTYSMSYDNTCSVFYELPQAGKRTSEQQQQQISVEYVNNCMEQLSTPWKYCLDNDETPVGVSEHPVIPMTVQNEQMESIIEHSWANWMQEEQQGEGRRKKKDKNVDTLGRDWFHMPAVPSNDIETQKAIKLLRLRRFIHPKRFYKSLGTEKSTHRFYQIGTVLDQPEEFFSGRLVRKERKNTFVDEFLSDPDLMRNTKERYKKIQMERQKLAKPNKWKKKVERTLPKWKRK